jgi:nucleotide-binding universal stress UspA family protein
MTSPATSPLTEPLEETSGPLVVGYDGSPSSLAAVRRGVSLAARLDRAVRVVVAWHIPLAAPGLPDNWSPSGDAEQMLSELTATLFPEGAPASFTTAAIQGDAAVVLIRESIGAEMVLVGSRGHSGIAGLLLGSVSTAVAEHAACPVLIMRTHVSASHEVANPVLTGATGR